MNLSDGVRRVVLTLLPGGRHVALDGNYMTPAQVLVLLTRALRDLTQGVLPREYQKAGSTDRTLVIAPTGTDCRGVEMHGNVTRDEASRMLIQALDAVAEHLPLPGRICSGAGFALSDRSTETW